jgi:hypothetical protein
VRFLTDFFAEALTAKTSNFSARRLQRRALFRHSQVWPVLSNRKSGAHALASVSAEAVKAAVGLPLRLAQATLGRALTAPSMARGSSGLDDIVGPPHLEVAALGQYRPGDAGKLVGGAIAKPAGDPTCPLRVFVSPSRRRHTGARHKRRMPTAV